MKNIRTKLKLGICASALASGLAISPAQAGQDTFASGITGGAEVSLLKPFQTEETTTGFGYDPATRIWFGYQGSNGVGVRARWWQYDERSSAPSSNFTRIKMQTIDLEATKAFKLGRMKGLVSGGLRFAEYREDDNGFSTIEIPSAYGLVAGVELRRPIYGRFSLFGEGRQSFLFDGSWNDGGTPRGNITFAISELKLGVEYAYPLMNTGLDLFGQLAGEAQFWNGMSDSDSESIGLSGVTLTLGIRAGGDADSNDDVAKNNYPSGFTGGTEVSLMKPYQSENSAVGFGRNAAYLGWIGYQGSSGLGARARWWQYDERSSNPASDFSRFKFETMDFEATQAFTLGNMQGLVSGGLRLAEYREEDGGLQSSTPSAYGLVAGVELRRPVYNKFSLFGTARQSIMFDNQLLDGGLTPERNVTFTTSELNLGVEYATPLMNTGLDVFGRVAAQAQYWNGMSDTDSEAAGLFGAALTLGIRAGGENAADEQVILRDYPRGVTAGAEVSLLKPFQSEHNIVGFGYSPATLVWAGYQSDSGLGIRGRWWRYKENSSNPGASSIDTLKMETFDVEATQAFMLGSLEGNISGGVRFAEYRQDGDEPDVPSAFGLVASLEVKRNLFGGLSVFGEGRQSIMFDNNWNDGSPEQNITFTISEAKIGLRYDQPVFGNRANLFGKVAAAGQYWSGVSDDDTENLGLLGAAFELGISAEF